MKRHVRSFIEWFLIFGLLTIVYIYNNHAVTLMLLFLGVLIPLISIILFLFSRNRLDYSLEFNPYLTNRNSRGNLVFRIHNRSVYPHTKVRLTFHISNNLNHNDYVHEIELYAGPRKTEVYPMPFVLAYCGVYRAELIKVSTSELFDFVGFHKNMNLNTEIVVLPGSIELNDAVYNLNGQSQDEDIFEVQNKGDDHSEIFEIRDYMMGDKLQSVHWKLSAKSEALLVKEFADLTGEMFQIFLELGYTDNKQMDAFFDLLWTVTNYFCEQKITFSICWMSADDEFHRESINCPENIIDVILHLYYEKVASNKSVSFGEFMNGDETLKSFFLITNSIHPKTSNMTVLLNNRNLARMYRMNK